MDPSLLEQASGLIEERAGLHFPPDRWPDLERGLSSAAGELGLGDAEGCARWLLSGGPSRDELALLAGHLTVGETYFFRGPEAFEALGSRILPGLLAEQRGRGDLGLRLWCAGCASGEEPYSLAILLDGLVPDLPDGSASILATDISARALRRAAEGLYQDWSFRSAPPWLRERYFSQEDGGWRLAPRIQRMVTLSCHNLAGDDWPSPETGTNAMDIVLCRNVLMYLSPGRAREVVRRLHRSLAEGGWLLLSPVEASLAGCAPFEIHRMGEGFAHRKASEAEILARGAAPAPSLPREPAAAPPAPSPRPSAAPPAPRRRAGPAAAQASTPSSPPADPREEAHRLYGEGRYAEAVALLAPHFARGAGGPADAGDLALLARACANLGRLADAQRWAERAADAGKLDPSRRFLLAAILQERGRADEAAAELRRVLYLDGGFVPAHVAMARLLMARGRGAEARRHLRTALGLLSALGRDAVVPESGGVAAGSLAEAVAAILAQAEGCA